MSVYTFSLLFFAIASFSSGFQILARRKDYLGTLYFVLNIFYAWWGVFFAFTASGIFSYNESLFWARFHNLGAAFIPVCWLHFVSVYTGHKNIKWMYWLYLLPCFLILFFNTDYFISELRSISGFKYYAVSGPFHYLSAALYFFIVPIGFKFLFEKAYKDKKTNHLNVRGFSMFSLVGYAVGAMTFFPCFGIDLPQYGLILMPLYPLGLSYFIMNYSLLTETDFAVAAHKDKLAALGILTASINHEIRGPLFAMRGVVETRSENEDLKNKLLAQIDRLTGIVSRLTHFAKKGVDEQAKIESLDLNEVLSDVRSLIQYQLNYQGIEYVQEIPANLPKLLADRRYLEEILFNLIINACQALKDRKDGRIKLSAMQVGKQIQIAVEDNGPGITPEQAKTIFKPFHTTKAEGTGLGLYITKQLIEKCGGTIAVSSGNASGAQFKAVFQS